MDVNNCVDINGNQINEILFNNDGTVVGVLETSGDATTSKLSYDCCVAQGYTFDPLEAKCYWSESCLSGGTYNIVLDPENNTGGLFQIDENQKGICHLEVELDFLIQFDCDSFTGRLKDSLENIILTLSVDKVIYDESLPIPNNLESVQKQEIFNASNVVDYFDGNTNTGIRLNGNNCSFLTQALINDLGSDSGVLSDNSLNSDWIHITMVVDDPTILETIYNERLKISIIGNNLDNFSIILDNIQLNRVCDVPIIPEFLNEECPKFNLKRIIDNKKSWVENTDYTLREFDLSRRETKYVINDDRLSINTKEIDLLINSSQAVQNDVLGFTVDYSCILEPATGCTSGSTTAGCIDLSRLITTPITEIVDNNELLNQLIDAKNRKTLSAYPTLELLYYRYLNSLEHCGVSSNVLNSETIDDFVTLIGTYWTDLLEQIVPATTIWGSSQSSGNNSFTNTLGSSGSNKFKYRNSTLFLCNTSPIAYPSPISGATANVGVISEDITDSNNIVTTTCYSVSIHQANYGSEFVGTVTILGDGEGPTTGDTISLTETIVDNCDKFEKC